MRFRRLCWRCAAEGNLASQCKVELYKPGVAKEVLCRFEKLTASEKLSMPMAVYARIKRWLHDGMKNNMGPIANPFDDRERKDTGAEVPPPTPPSSSDSAPKN